MTRALAAVQSGRAVERRQALVAAIVLAGEDLPCLPLYYQVDVHAVRLG
jgi:hypothetical protein